MNVQTKAIILKTQKYKEYDEIITAFTKDYGKIRMFARASKRLKSPLLSGTQLFSYSDLRLDLRSNGSRLFEAKPVKSFYEFSYDLSKYYLACFICEVVDKYQMENQTDSRFFDRIITVFKIMLQTGHIKLIRIIFELFLLESLGFRPQTYECFECHTNDGEKLSFFHLTNGSALCEKCAKNYQIAEKIDRNMIKFFSYVYKYAKDDKKLSNIKISKVLLEKTDEFLNRYMDIHIGKMNLDSYNILKEEEKKI